MKKIVSIAMSVASAACVATGCDGASPAACDVVEGTASATRADGLAALERDVFAPRRAALIAGAAELVTAVESFCDAPDHSNLEDAREAWRATVLPAKSFELYIIGPLLADRLYSRLQFWPTRVDKLETTIAAAPEGGYTATATSELGTAVTGLAALEAMLFRADTVDEATCGFAVSVALDVKASADALDVAWTVPGGLGDGLAHVGRGSAVFPCVQPAVDDLINVIVSGIQRLYDSKLGAPLGITTGGDPDPTAVEHPWAETNLASIGASIETFEAMWNGAGGFGAAVGAESAEVQVAVADQLVRVREALTTAENAGSLVEQLATDTSRIVALRTELKALYRLVTVEVANVLGTRLRFSDNDGD